MDTIDPYAKIVYRQLPTYDAGKRCPKCWYDLVSTEYASVGRHSGCPEWSPWPRYSRFLFMYDKEEREKQLVEETERIFHHQKVDQHLGVRPHLDRVCKRCGYSWIEEAVDNESH